ncbi:hypothetical protein PFISCL1PPCAC_20140, partial [Pristionchus fissidentatus]
NCSSVKPLCTGADRLNCAAPFVPFKQRYRFTRRYNLIGCAIEKNFSTLLTAILCFLHDEKKFVSRERILVKEEFHHRFCGPRNEASTLEQSFKRIGGRNESTTLFAITRDPVDRFISGFVDKCLKEETWRSHPDRCCGCKRDVDCFVDRMHKRIIKSQGEKQRTSFDDDHFFPQSWRCEFSTHISDYTILDFSAGDSSQFYTKLLKLLHDNGVPPSSLSLIESSLHSDRTDHSTIESKERLEYENRIRNSPSIMEKITRMYYYDFIL